MCDLTRIGVYAIADGAWQCCVWAPLAANIELCINGNGGSGTMIALAKDELGYWRADLPCLHSNERYQFSIDGHRMRPDPASMYQPEGPHAASAVVDHARFQWTDQNWRNVSLAEYIIYELHVGTFSAAGTFAGVCEKLDYLQKLGVTAIELMPVAQFPGTRNWGYDGTYPFAVHNSYGQPDALKALVNLCHARGIAVIMDVVYNHLGPEGNYLRDFAPYFTAKYRTPWGDAINYDDAYSYGVRNYFIQNALYWFREFHVDGLRLDAVHGIFDMSAKHILAELGEVIEECSLRAGRPLYLIAESDLNDVRVITPRAQGGYGMHAQWSDDFHHAVHVALTGERNGYYEDFGNDNEIADVFEKAFLYDGRYSHHRKRCHGSNAQEHYPGKFVVAIQNHDQVGNRMEGERLSALVSFEQVKLAAGLLLCSPYVPLIFMGEEFAADTPFLYCISHGDAALVEAVRAGRKAEFKSFGWHKEPPDPFAAETMQKSRLAWDSIAEGDHAVLLRLYTTLIQMRKEHAVMRCPDRRAMRVIRHSGRVFASICQDTRETIACIFNAGSRTVDWDDFPLGRPRTCLVNSSDVIWRGPGTTLPPTSTPSVTIHPYSFIVVTHGKL